MLPSPWATQPHYLSRCGRTPCRLRGPQAPRLPRPLTVSAGTVAPVPAAASVPVEAPGSARAVSAPAEVVALPSQWSPARRGRPLQQGWHVRPAQTRGAEVRHVDPGPAGGAAPGVRLDRSPRVEGKRTLRTGRRRGARGTRQRGQGRPPRPLLGGKMGRKLGTRQARMAVAVVEGVTEDRLRADHFREQP